MATATPTDYQESIPDSQPNLKQSDEHMMTLGEILEQYPAPRSQTTETAHAQNKVKYYARNSLHRAIKVGALAGAIIGCFLIALLIVRD